MTGSAGQGAEMTGSAGQGAEMTGSAGQGAEMTGSAGQGAETNNRSCNAAGRVWGMIFFINYNCQFKLLPRRLRVRHSTREEGLSLAVVRSRSLVSRARLA